MVKKQLSINDIIAKNETASTFNETGDWIMDLNKIEVTETERRALFYRIEFPFNAKAEFFDGTIHIQEYPLEDS